MFNPRLRTFAIAISLLTLFAITSRAQKLTADIPYTTIGGTQKADFYEPAGSPPPQGFPAIIYIHGGSWRSGNKHDFRKLATDLAAQGYAGFSIDYDLHAHSYPTSWLQAQDAVRFLRAHAAEYHIDPNKIVVAGASAGGQLAALLALAPQGPAQARPTSSATPNTPVAAAIILNGVFDLHSSAHVIERYLGTDCRSTPDICNDASPNFHLHPGAPPFFIGHGTADKTVAYSEAFTFVTALRDHNIPVTLYTAQNGPHMYFDKADFYAPNLAALESFLAATLHSTATSH